jgi:hypothetical protein
MNREIEYLRSAVEWCRTLKPHERKEVVRALDQESQAEGYLRANFRALKKRGRVNEAEAVRAIEDRQQWQRW